jgi:hypothetical protein
MRRSCHARRDQSLLGREDSDADPEHALEEPARGLDALHGDVQRPQEVSNEGRFSLCDVICDDDD